MLLYKGALLAQGRIREIRDLIDRHPHTVTVECTAPRKLSEYFHEAEATMHLEYEENALIIRTRDPNECFTRLNQLYLDNPDSIQGISCTDDDLQSVFKYLTH